MAVIKFCSNCGTPNDGEPRFCRSCGFQIVQQTDPATLNGHAIAKFIIGDAFVLPAVLLTVLESSVQSVLWILLAVPGLLLYTWAAVDLVKARAIKRNSTELPGADTPRELGAPVPTDMPIDFTDREVPVSVTDRTTRELPSPAHK